MANSHGNGDSKFHNNDRVKRADGQGVQGTVITVRADAILTAADAKEKGVVIGVQWDNGTYSYFVPDALVAA